jgi:hypothetical protein
MPMVLNYQFFSYSDEGDCIIIRYFTAGIVGGKKNSFEINKTTFSGYKIKSSFFGIIQSLVLFQKVQGGVATYPPVYISALSKDEKAKVKKSLNLYNTPL